MHHVLRTEDGSPRGIIQPDNPDFEIGLEAYRDVQHLEFILETRPDPPPEGFLSLLRNVVDDPVLPQGSVKESPGRDAQAELYVAAICRKASLEPVRHDEPDVLCWLGNTQLAVAVKRLKSVDILEKRVRAAAKQIKRSGLPGIVVLDTSLALNPDNARIWRQVTDYEFARRYPAVLRGVIKEHYDRLQSWVRGKWVSGVVIHDHQIRLTLNEGWRLEGVTYGIGTAPWNQRRTREFDDFYAKYCRALPNNTGPLDL